MSVSLTLIFGEYHVLLILGSDHFPGSVEALTLSQGVKGQDGLTALNGPTLFMRSVTRVLKVASIRSEPIGRFWAQSLAGFMCD